MKPSASPLRDATPGRLAAHAILKRVRSGTTFEIAFDREANDLADEDRRLAYQLAAGVLRQRDQLDGILAPLTRHGWRSVAPPLKDILRLGAYQLIHLDRVPRHAAVATAVALARATGQPRAAGFVNALLRRIAAEDSAGLQSVGPTGFQGHPEWLVDRWRERFGREHQALLEWNNTVPRLTVQPYGITTEELAARLTAKGVSWQPAPFEAGLTMVSASSPVGLPGFAEGRCYVQDPAQALVVKFAGRGPGLALDLCAAPGGKTLGLAAAGWTVVASDARRSRMARLRENLDRADSGAGMMVLADAMNPPFASADLVMLDAPCSGTGTLARHPDARHRLREEEISRLAEQQRVLLERAAPLVKEEGLLVYATCSLEPEENELQIAHFLDQNPSFTRDPVTGFPEELVSSAGDLVILPQRHSTDGAYCARLRRVG